MDGWYYSQSGQSVGPVSLAELKQLVAGGQVGRDDPVWHPSMADWTAARKVPGLAALRQQAAQPAFEAQHAPQAADPYADQQAPPEGNYYQQQPQGMLGYQGAATGDIVATARTLGFLRQTRPWVMFIAVLFFLGAALLALAGLFMLFGGSMLMSSSRGRSSANASGFMVGAAVAYFVFGFVYFLLGFFLTRYFSSIGTLLGRRNSADLEAAMGAQLQFWRVLGISIICMIVLYLLVLAVVFVAGL